MKGTLTERILKSKLVAGQLETGTEITIKIDQTLTQDSTGTMVYLELDAMGVSGIKTEKSVAYIDHNTLQTGFYNADDHAFIESVAKKYGVVFQKPGGGICHQLHMENYGIPGKTLLGSDSHTPTGGGIGMIAIGAGGLDVSTAMALGTYTLTCPAVFGVKLTGELRGGVSAKDVILEVLRKLTVKGGVKRIIEYFGEGVKNLSATDRATITNMGAELGATTSIFPSDERTKEYLKIKGREGDYIELKADETATYEDVLEINLSEVNPLAAMPHSPDNVKEIKGIGKIKVDQVAIGSCTNSSYTDLMKVAKILKGKKINEGVSLVISPGSAAIMSKMISNGTMRDLIDAGARIIENACGPCIGMGQSPKSGAVSLRTFNRNFKGRSGTNDADVYLVSPETAAISSLTGYLTSLEDEGTKIDFKDIKEDISGANTNDAFTVNSLGKKNLDEEVIKGPNIKPFPVNDQLPENISCQVSLKVGDNITTDDIMPSDASLLPFRSNIPHLSKFCFSKIDDTFSAHAEKFKVSAIIGGENYGQGSSREHASLAPLHLGIKFVIAKSFARIHRSNLINSGITPFTFKDSGDYDKIDQEDKLNLEGIRNFVANIKVETDNEIQIKNETNDTKIPILLNVSKDEKEMLLAGGKITLIKEQVKKQA